MKSEIGTMPAPVVIPKSMEQVERDHQGLCDLIRRDVRRIVAEELDGRGLVDRGTNPVSAEEFIRRNPELHGLVRDAVREELEAARADGKGPFSDLFEADRASWCPVRSHLVAGAVNPSSEDNAGAVPGRRFKLFAHRGGFGVTEPADQRSVESYIPHIITSLLCVACTILALKTLLEGGE